MQSRFVPWGAEEEVVVAEVVGLMGGSKGSMELVDGSA